ncbi:hypothetical protein [Actinacidiphila rubida]|nr:hypothetical protein [Actinacidiphila rubida]
MDAINGNLGDALTNGLAATSGAIGGLYGGRRGGGPHDEPHLTDTDFKLPDLPDLNTPGPDNADGIFTTPLPLDPTQTGNGTWARTQWQQQNPPPAHGEHPEESPSAAVQRAWAQERTDLPPGVRASAMAAVAANERSFGTGEADNAVIDPVEVRRQLDRQADIEQVVSSAGERFDSVFTAWAASAGAPVSSGGKGAGPESDPRAHVLTVPGAAQRVHESAWRAVERDVRASAVAGRAFSQGELQVHRLLDRAAADDVRKVAAVRAFDQAVLRGVQGGHVLGADGVLSQVGEQHLRREFVSQVFADHREVFGDPTTNGRVPLELSGPGASGGDTGTVAGGVTGASGGVGPVVGRSSAESVRRAATPSEQPHTVNTASTASTVNTAGTEARSAPGARTTGADTPVPTAAASERTATGGREANPPAVGVRSSVDTPAGQRAATEGVGGSDVSRSVQQSRSEADAPTPLPRSVGGLDAGRGGDVKSPAAEAVASPERVWQDRVASRLDALPGRVEVELAKEAAARNAMDTVHEAAKGSWRQALPDLGNRFTEAFGLDRHGADSRTEQAAALALARDAHARIDTWAAAPHGPKDPGGTPLPGARHVAEEATAPAAARHQTALAVARATALDDAAHEARTQARRQPGSTPDSVERAVEEHTDHVGPLFDRLFRGAGPGSLDRATATWTTERGGLTARLHQDVGVGAPHVPTATTETPETVGHAPLVGREVTDEVVRSVRHEVNRALRTLKWPGSATEATVRERLADLPLHIARQPERAIGEWIAGTLAHHGDPLGLSGGAPRPDSFSHEEGSEAGPSTVTAHLDEPSTSPLVPEPPAVQGNDVPTELPSPQLAHSSSMPELRGADGLRHDTEPSTLPTPPTRPAPVPDRAAAHGPNLSPEPQPRSEGEGTVQDLQAVRVARMLVARPTGMDEDLYEAAIRQVAEVVRDPDIGIRMWDNGVRVEVGRAVTAADRGGRTVRLDEADLDGSAVGRDAVLREVAMAVHAHGLTDGERAAVATAHVRAQLADQYGLEAPTTDEYFGDLTVRHLDGSPLLPPPELTDLLNRLYDDRSDTPFEREELTTSPPPLPDTRTHRERYPEIFRSDDDILFRAAADQRADRDRLADLFGSEEDFLAPRPPDRSRLTAGLPPEPAPVQGHAPSSGRPAPVRRPVEDVVDVVEDTGEGAPPVREPVRDTVRDVVQDIGRDTERDTASDAVHHTARGAAKVPAAEEQVTEEQRLKEKEPEAEVGKAPKEKDTEASVTRKALATPKEPEGATKEKAPEPPKKAPSVHEEPPSHERPRMRAGKEPTRGERDLERRDERPRREPSPVGRGRDNPAWAEQWRRPIGVPRAGLPHIPAVVERLRDWAQELGYIVPEGMWNRLPQRLLSNYPFMVVGRGDRPEGLLVSLGPVEALIGLDPSDPRPYEGSGPVNGRRLPTIAEEDEGEDGGPATRGDGTLVRKAKADTRKPYHATATVNSSFATGGHTQTESGGTSGTRVGVSTGYGIGLPGVAHLLNLGVGVSGTANASSRSRTHLADSERGHVEDNRDGRGPQLLSYRANWQLRLRPVDRGAAWPAARRVHEPDSESLLLWVARPYLDRPGEQIVATGPDVRTDRIPGTYFASGLTGLPALFDGIGRVMAEGGLPLSADPRTRSELVHRLWNLQTFLDEAVNSPQGYTFRLHDRYGRTVATIRVHSQRLLPGEEQVVGVSSSTAHLENVRTSIDGIGGGHTLAQSSTLTPLTAELDMLPSPVSHPDAGLGVNLNLSTTWSSSEAVGSMRTGLWVMVPRFSGPTSAYVGSFRHYAEVTLRSDGADQVHFTDPVPGDALIRVPRHLAFQHGFPVDRDALHDDSAVVGDTVAYDADAIKDAPSAEQRQARPLPAHLTDPARYTGIGMGLVEVHEETADRLYNAISGVLDQHGFLLPRQDNPVGGRSWWQLGSGLDSRVDNEDILRKFLVDGLPSHHDRMHQADGMVLELHRRRGFAGVEFDVDTARITITATRTKPVEFLDSASDHHLVNLAMGMDSASATAAGGHSVSAALRVKGSLRQLLGGAEGFGVNFGRSASDSVFYLNNRPELLEYGEGDFLRVRITSTYTATITFRHSGWAGSVNPGRRDPVPVYVTDQPAIARVLPLGDGREGYAVGPKDHTPARVLDQAVIYHLDTSGFRRVLSDSMGADLDGPSGPAARFADSMTASLRAHLKEAAFGALTTDLIFDNGLFRDTHVAVDVKASLDRSDFIGATNKAFVHGIIKLWLAQSTISTSTSRGVTWIQADITAGGPNAAGTVNTSGGADASRHFQFNSSQSHGVAGAKELIALSFSHVYLYRSHAAFDINTMREAHGKLAPASYRPDSRQVRGREVMYLVPEPEALGHYADGDLPVSHEQLTDAMDRWTAGDLKLHPNTAAGVLARWQQTPAGRAATAPHAAALHQRHHDGADVVWDAKARADFTAAFPHLPLDARANPLASLRLPEYLTRQDVGGSLLGHSNVLSIDHKDGLSTADLFHQAVDDAAPGLLTHSPHLWTAGGRHIGRLQGSLDTVVGLFGRGRDDAAYEDLLSANGAEFYLTNQVGWFLADVVKVTIRARLLPGATVVGRRADAGLENYSHHYTNTSVGASRDDTQSATAGKIGAARPDGGGGTALAAASGVHRGTTHSEAGVQEQTVYSWNGLAELHVPHYFTVTAVRVDMAHRPLNELAIGAFRAARGLGEPGIAGARGITRLQIPGALVDATHHPQPDPLAALADLPPATAGSSHHPAPSFDRDLRRLPKLPGDAYVAGVVVDDALPAARRMLQQAFGNAADAERYRGSPSLPVLLSRTHLANVLGRMGPQDRALLAEHLFVPGRSSYGLRLHLQSSAYDLQVLSDIDGTGTGRYNKHQSGTNVSASTDHWRPTLSANGNAGSPFARHPADSGSGSSSANHLTSLNHAAAGTNNYRREQHVKQQGDTQLVRIRVQLRLHAQGLHRHIFAKPRPDGEFTSEPVNGEMYVEMSRDEVAQVRAQLTEIRRSTAGQYAHWHSAATARPIDLAPLLLGAANAPGADAGRADLAVSRLVREDAGASAPDAPRGLALTVDGDHLALEGHRAILSWAVNTLSDDHAAIRTADASAPPPEEISSFTTQLHALPAAASDPARAAAWRRATRDIVATVQKYHVQRPDNPLRDGAPLPPRATFAAVDPRALARDIAHHLDAYVRYVPHGNPDEPQWIAPDGEIHTVRPAPPAMPPTMAYAFTPAPLRMGPLRSAATAARETRLALGGAPPVASDLVTGKPSDWYAGKLAHTPRAGQEVNRPSGSGAVRKETPAVAPVPNPVQAPAPMQEPAPAE